MKIQGLPIKNDSSPDEDYFTFNYSELLSRVCIGHQLPTFQQPEGTTIIGPLENSGKEVCHVSDDWGGPQLSGLILAEYCQLFWLADRIKGAGDGLRFIVLSQYRKFISLQPGSTRASNAPYTFVATPEGAPRLNLSDTQVRHMLSQERTHLVGPVLKIGSTIENYARYHLLSDFLAFCEQMLRSGRFSPELVARFASSNALIPAPSLGLHPVDEFLSDMATLQSVWELFYHTSYEKRDGYQRRVGGFLLERLHSFLIYERLKENPQQFISGHQYVVVAAGDFAPPTI
jgi:hypothetical protein